MLLLTATPLHLGNQDLFHLLNILAPGDFDSLEAFRQQIYPNQFINRASQQLGSMKKKEALRTLRQVEKGPSRKRFLRNPYYQDTLNILQQSHPSRSEFIQAQRNLLELSTLSHVFTRTRKRDVVINAPVRAANSLIVEFTQPEWDFYQAIIAYVRAQYILNSGNWATGWATIMRERQAASCITAVRKHFSDLIHGNYKSTPEDESALDGLFDDDFSYRMRSNDIKRLDKALRKLVRTGLNIGNIDTKFDVFHNALIQVLDENPSSKILVFSFFRNTLGYLHRRLSDLGFGVRMIRGGVPVQTRKRIVEEFRDKPQINILLSSEVGSEGLDFQYCNTLFNYDLPWNPMKVEQRIGRLDRFGQKNPRINIYNLVIENSIEERIFLRLYERIGIFKEAVGDLEAILGDEIRTISNQIFRTQLTPKQEERLADQAATNIIRRKQDMEEFEKDRMQFMGQDAIFADEVKSAIESGKFVSEKEIRALVETFIRQNFSHTRLEDNDDDPTCALIPGTDFVKYMRDLIMRTRAADQSAQEFLRRLTVGKLIPLTYSSEIAFDRKLVDFITLKHPITLAAADYWENNPSQGLPVYQINVEADVEPFGIYYFFIFSFLSEGLQRRNQIVPVVVNHDSVKVESEVGSRFMRIIQSPSSSETIYRDKFDMGLFSSAKEVAKNFAASERDRRETDLRKTNYALVNARLSAIEQTYQLKTQKIRGYLSSVTDPRIIRMRRAQLNNIESRYLTTVKEIEEQRNISVSFSLELAGIAEITPSDQYLSIRQKEAEEQPSIAMPEPIIEEPQHAQLINDRIEESKFPETELISRPEETEKKLIQEKEKSFLEKFLDLLNL
jgi:hypothetical protein